MRFRLTMSIYKLPIQRALKLSIILDCAGNVENLYVSLTIMIILHNARET